MANGILCKKCGHQEGAHAFIDEARSDEEGERRLNYIDDSKVKLEGYPQTLDECMVDGGYTPE